MRYLCLFILYLPVCYYLHASGDKDTSKVYFLTGLKLHQGFVIIHSKEIRAIKNSYPNGIEFDLAWHSTSKKSWSSCHCYPRLGVSTTFWNFDNKEILGYGLTSLFYIEPVFGAWHIVSFSFRAGFGLSYCSKPYNELTNPDNMSYSTKIAFPMLLGAALNFRLRPQLSLNISSNYNHISNGGIKEPNKGINWPSISIGLDYYHRKPAFKVRKKVNWRETEIPETRFDITIFSAFKELEPKHFYPVPGVELKGSRQIARINALTIGAEWLYDNAARYDIEKAGEDIDCNKASIAIGHEFLLGKFIFSQQIGFYVYRPYKVGDDVYQRYGLIYRATNWFLLGINLKAHRHVANFIDLRIGFSF